MKCHRCEGLMVHDTITDTYYTEPTYRCVNCGEILDNTVLNNRIIQYRIVKYKQERELVR